MFLSCCVFGLVAFTIPQNSVILQEDIARRNVGGMLVECCCQLAKVWSLPGMVNNKSALCLASAQNPALVVCS